MFISTPANRTKDDALDATARDAHGHDEHEQHEHDLGLSHDLPTLLNRRRLLSFLGGTGAAVALAACGSSDDTPTTSSSIASTTASSSASATTASTDTTESTDTEIPEETAGPYPADGSNGINVLTESGIVRSDLTKSFGSASGVADGIPLTIKLKVLDVSNDGAALAGAAVYLWHCDQAGNYSMYSDAAVNENYLRGVQEADSDGSVTFKSIFPAAYSGRWPHIHFEVYPSLKEATTASTKLRTSQLALPEDVSNAVYATDGYEASISNMTRTSLTSDMVFSDGYSLQMAKVTGSVADGYTATLNVPV